jgi:hypothetical protein
MTPQTPDDTITLTTYHGVQVDPADVTAIYHADESCWTDMPEARPRARCRKLAAPGDPRVVCLTDGIVLSDPDAVELDVYAGDGYEQVRAEGEARWARVDALEPGAVTRRG